MKKFIINSGAGFVLNSQGENPLMTSDISEATTYSKYEAKRIKKVLENKGFLVEIVKNK